MKLKFKHKKIAVVFTLAIAVAVTGYLFVRAQTITDTYDDDSLIYDLWNISTSTAGQTQLAERECDDAIWHCSASTTCSNLLGNSDYIIVIRDDAPSTKKWKPANNDCDRPECGEDGYQSTDNLVADNTVIFTDYPARDYCDSVGGRLPTINELACMYTNRAEFGDNFEADRYWSSGEFNETLARMYDFSTGSASFTNKLMSYYVRCVRGW